MFGSLLCINHAVYDSCQSAEPVSMHMALLRHCCKLVQGSIPTAWLNGSSPPPIMSLRRFACHHCGLTGPLPSWGLSAAINCATDAYSLPNLQQFDVAFNALTGTIPASFASWYAIQNLTLRHNLLAGSITNAWMTGCGWNNLRMLLLDNNALNGALPSGERLAWQIEHRSAVCCGQLNISST